MNISIGFLKKLSVSSIGRTFGALVMAGTIAADSFAAGAAAFGNEVVSARAMGQGGVGVAAQSNDPAAVFINPAGLTQMPGTQASYGVSWENLHGMYTDDAGDKTKMRSVDAAVPNFAFTHTMMDGKLGMGLSTEAPYGLETHWSGDSPLRYVTTNSKLHMVVLSPAVAYQIDPRVSVGAGADYYNDFDTQLERHIDAGGAGIVSQDANSRLSGTGTNWGYHAGLLLQPTEQHALGIVYHSKVKMTIKGTVELSGLSGPLSNLFGGSDYQTAAYTDLYIPQNVQFGYAFKPNSKWMLEMDTAWYDWYADRDLNIRYAETNSMRLDALNLGNPTPSLRRNAWSFATGANYRQNDRMQYRGGFFYLPYATPESTFTPALMDLTRYGLSGGIGIGLMPRLTLDLSYTAVFYHNRSITNTVAADTTGDSARTIDGTYGNFVNIVMFNLTYRL